MKFFVRGLEFVSQVPHMQRILALVDWCKYFVAIGDASVKAEL
jgi:hypothetical protein